MNLQSIQVELGQFILDEVLQRPDFPLQPDTSLIRGGLLHSFAQVKLVNFIEQRYAIELADEDLVVDNLDTLAQIGALILRVRHASLS